MSNGLDRYIAAERMLAEIQTMDDADQVMRLAEAARVFAERERLGTAMVNHATAIKLKSARRLVELYDAQPKTVGGRGHKTPAPPAGVSERRIREFRQVGAVIATDAEVDRRAEEATRRDKPLSMNRLLREARDAEAAAKREQEATAAKTLPTLPTCDLRAGDFRAALADVRGVDAIITDPPYPAEFLPLLGDLAKFADESLTPDGVLAVLIGQTHLPEVYRLLAGGRPYRWTMAYLTPGAAYASHARRLQSKWKPVIVYGGGPRFDDVVASSGDDKRHHQWGQNAGAFIALVERLTTPGALVCDPFLGGGTTALAARVTGRRFVGCDVDETNVLSTRSRLEGAA